MKALIDLGSEVNIIHSVYATNLALCTRKTDVEISKIDASRLHTFGILVAGFLVKDKMRKG